MKELPVALLSSLLILTVACSKDKRLQADAVDNRASFPIMETRDVTTLISDSGVTRYRIHAPLWQIYDQANPPHQEFKEGIYLEKFNEQLQVEASLQADYAYYNESLESWELDGHVVALNEAGEKFETEQLIWEQPTEMIHTDSMIKITKATSVIEGEGFISNQNMTKYTILHPTGYFPIEE